jgi:hypothetical protein
MAASDQIVLFVAATLAMRGKVIQRQLRAILNSGSAVGASQSISEVDGKALLLLCLSVTM